MGIFAQIISYSLIAIFAQNIVFSHALGFNVAVYASQKRSRMLHFSLTIFVTVMLSSLLTALADELFFEDSAYYIYMPLIYIVIISIVYICGLLLIWRFVPKLFQSLKNYVHVAVFNCAIVGSLILNAVEHKNFWSYFGFGLGQALGFIFAGYLLLNAAKRLNSPEIPKAFRGFPITMVYTGILSMAFYALSEFAFK